MIEKAYKQYLNYLNKKYSIIEIDDIFYLVDNNRISIEEMKKDYIFIYDKLYSFQSYSKDKNKVENIKKEIIELLSNFITW